MFPKSFFITKENTFLVPLFFYFLIIFFEKDLFSDRPAAIFHWRLFTQAAHSDEHFYDISYSTSSSNLVKYFSKTSRELSELGLNIVQINWALEEFDSRNTPAANIINEFKSYCHCQNLKLVKRIQNKGRFVFFSDKAQEVTIYED